MPLEERKFGHRDTQQDGRVKPQGHTQAREGESNRKQAWNFLGDPVVGHLPSSAGDMGSIPGPETKIPHAQGQLSPCTTSTEPTGSKSHAPQQVKASATRSPWTATRQEPPLATTTESRRAAVKAQLMQPKINKEKRKKETNPAHSLMSDFQPPELEDNKNPVV